MLDLEMKSFSGYYRRHLLQFGKPPSISSSSSAGDTANLSNDGAIGALAWVVCNFVAYVVEDPRLLWEATLDESTPLAKCMCPSDIAFAVLVLEHHMIKWRHLIRFGLETGQLPSKDYTQEAPGLLYDQGIAGPVARKRFDGLVLYFVSNFFARSSPDTAGNMRRLGDMVRGMAKPRSAWIKEKIRRCTADYKAIPIHKNDPIEDVEDDVLHRVFYYMHF